MLQQLYSSAVFSALLTISLGLGATTAEANRSLLKSAKSWTYQLHGNVAPIAGGAADVAVIDWDHVHDRGMLARLKQKPGGGRRLVIGYLSIGEAETYRGYWKSCCAGKSPSWLTGKTQGWSGNYVVRYWDPAWKAIVRQQLSAMLEAGLDGVYLDRADSWESMRKENSNARGAMIALVKELSAQARGRNPNFAVMVQNAEELLTDASYVAAIDAVAKESLFYGVAGAGRRNSAGDISASLRDLKRAQSNGKSIFVIEYLSGEGVERARSDIRAQGFVPFVASRHLSGGS